MQDVREIYMQRCLDLAISGAGNVAPNPMVGAVLVHEDTIIGEGYHGQYGGPHAEVNCIDSVSEANRLLIPASTLYVSLEPCAHFGKTPPCSDLIIQQKIKKVVIGCRDPFEEVNGKGIEKLRSAGVEVITGILEKECMTLNKRFFTVHVKHRPYIIIKWAQTNNGKIAGDQSERLLISNDCSNRLVHKWRSEEAAILVGTHTALKDDPSLTNRLWTGNNPVRMVLDMSLRLPAALQLFNGEQRTIVFNAIKQETNGNIEYHQVSNKKNIPEQILTVAYQLQLQSILIEGGAKLLQSFIDAGLWDEARVINNEELTIDNGLAAPILNQPYDYKEKIISDTIYYYTNKQVNQ